MAELQEDPPAELSQSIEASESAEELPSEQDDKTVSDAPELFQFPGNPRIVPRSEHPISRRLIDYDALKTMYRLIRAGHKAFLVGGGVRDLLLGRKPKDFDIGTDAKPEEVRALFRNSRIIGRRFRLNQVYYRGGKIFEVSTFRASNSQPDEEGEPQLLASDNVYGNEESDALRRDLTINGLFYDPNSYAVIDYVGGIEDLKNSIVRTIGDPDVRFQEDPVRMIRAVRHAARTDFTIEPQTEAAIRRHAPLIAKVVKARVYEEFMRDIRGGVATSAVRMFQNLGLLKFLLPELDRLISEGEPELVTLLGATLERLDRRAKSGVELPSSVVLLALCIDSFAVIRSLPGERPGERLKSTINELYREVGVTKRDREDMELVIAMAHQMFRASQLGRERAMTLVSRPYLREAFLLIELTANNDTGHACLEFWDQLMRSRPSGGGGERRRRRSRRRR